MKKVGIIGGLGPEATMDYYKEIISGFNNINTTAMLDYPEIIIYSVNMSKFIGYLQDENYFKASLYISNCINKLEIAGVDFAVISANTPHLLFDNIKASCNVPLISIVESCALEARELKLKRCGLLGTGFTMKNDFYEKVFQNYSIEIIAPDETQIEKINYRLFNELELGIFKKETEKEILDIVNIMKENHQIDSIILGCTEFPLMFKKEEYLGIPFLNTTKIHVNAIIEACIENKQLK